MESVLKDKRFSQITNNPRFRRMPLKERKVKIDKRFKSMFDDKSFKLKYSVDKRGRPVQTTSNEDLRKFYELSDDESDESVENSNDSEVGGDSNTANEVAKSNIHLIKDIISDVDKGTAKMKMGTESVNEKKTSMKGRTENLNIAMERTNIRNSNQSSLLPKSLQEKKSKKGKIKVIKKNKTEVIPQYDSDSDSVTSDAKLDQTTRSENEKEQAKANLDSEEISGAEEEQEQGDASDEKSVNDKKHDDIALSVADLARGEGNIESSDDSESDDDYEEEKGEEFDHRWGELDNDAPTTEDFSNRLAICNLDWDRIKARDLMVILNSFTQTGGSVISVKIYPSEYGKERMKQEELKGPSELVSGKQDFDSDDEKLETVEGDSYHLEKLRQYQLNRLRYYYAVAEFESVSTACHVYDECDGMEYESSTNHLDLRFIPEDMTFDDPSSSVAEDVPDVASYKPSMFNTAALSQSKVNLTWDETDHERLEVTMKKFTKAELQEMDFKAYLASSSDEDDVKAPEDESSGADNDDEETRIQKYKQLLGGLEDAENKNKRRDIEMEITWEPGLKETADSVIRKSRAKQNQSPWEEYLQRRKTKASEKKREKREERRRKKRESKTPADAVDTIAFSDDELPEGVDLDDPYFKEAFKEANVSTVKGSTGDKKGKKKKKKKSLTQEELEEQKQREAELSLLLMDEDDHKHHFNLNDLIQNDKKKKGKKRHNETATTPNKEDFQINVEDFRFDAMYSSHLYNIDPSAPEFKKTKAMESLIEEKQRRRKHPTLKNTSDRTNSSTDFKRKAVNDTEPSENVEKDPKLPGDADRSLSYLVKSVKTKTKLYQQRKK